MGIRAIFSVAAYAEKGPLVSDSVQHRFLMRDTKDRRTVGMSGGFPVLDVNREEDIYPELRMFVLEYRIDESFQLGLAFRKRGIYRHQSAEIVLRETIVNGGPGFKVTGQAENFADLDGLYRKIRAGQIGPEEDWDVAQGSPQLDELRQELQMLGRERARDAEELVTRSTEMVRLRHQLSEEQAKVRGCEARIAQLEGEKQGLTVEVKLLRERVTALLGNIWHDMFKVGWWQGKKALRRVVGNSMRAEPMLFEMMSGEDQSAVREACRPNPIGYSY